jgi:hypothetical protein
VFATATSIASEEKTGAPLESNEADELYYDIMRQVDQSESVTHRFLWMELENFLSLSPAERHIDFNFNVIEFNLRNLGYRCWFNSVGRGVVPCLSETDWCSYQLKEFQESDQISQEMILFLFSHSCQRKTQMFDYFPSVYPETHLVALIMRDFHIYFKNDSGFTLVKGRHLDTYFDVNEFFAWLVHGRFQPLNIRLNSPPRIVGCGFEFIRSKFSFQLGQRKVCQHEHQPPTGQNTSDWSLNSLSHCCFWTKKDDVDKEGKQLPSLTELSGFGIIPSPYEKGSSNQTFVVTEDMISSGGTYEGQSEERCPICNDFGYHDGSHFQTLPRFLCVRVNPPVTQGSGKEKDMMNWPKMSFPVSLTITGRSETATYFLQSLVSRQKQKLHYTNVIFDHSHEIRVRSQDDASPLHVKDYKGTDCFTMKSVKPLGLDKRLYATTAIPRIIFYARQNGEGVATEAVSSYGGGGAEGARQSGGVTGASVEGGSFESGISGAGHSDEEAQDLLSKNLVSPSSSSKAITIQWLMKSCCASFSWVCDKRSTLGKQKLTITRTSKCDFRIDSSAPPKGADDKHFQQLLASAIRVISAHEMEFNLQVTEDAKEKLMDILIQSVRKPVVSNTAIVIGTTSYTFSHHLRDFAVWKIASPPAEEGVAERITTEQVLNAVLKKIGKSSTSSTSVDKSSKRLKTDSGSVIVQRFPITFKDKDQIYFEVQLRNQVYGDSVEIVLFETTTEEEKLKPYEHARVRFGITASALGEAQFNLTSLKVQHPDFKSDVKLFQHILQLYALWIKEKCGFMTCSFRSDKSVLAIWKEGVSFPGDAKFTWKQIHYAVPNIEPFHLPWWDATQRPAVQEVKSCFLLLCFLYTLCHSVHSHHRLRYLRRTQILKSHCERKSTLEAWLLRYLMADLD